MMTAIDQQTRRRICKTGLTAFDPSSACPGYVLYTPIRSKTLYLINLQGEIVHQWEVAYTLYTGYFLPNGHLFYMGKVLDDGPELVPDWKKFKGGIVQELDWEGRVVWELRLPNHHHDAKKLPSGGVVYIALERIPDDLAKRVQNGRFHQHGNGVFADALIEVNARGENVWEWHAFEHLDPERDWAPPAWANERNEWTHLNTLVSLDDDRLLICSKPLSLVGVIEKRSGNWLWKLGGHELFGMPHDPSLLPNGNLLIFDNGVWRTSTAYPFSRVLEINLRTHAIEWCYQDPYTFNFFSPYLSGAQRLPDGNTLIVEGSTGRLFQVTPDGEVVWEFINPHFMPYAEDVVTNTVCKARHYMPGEIPALG